MRNPWTTRLGFHLHRALFRMSGRAIFRSRLAPLHYLIHHQRFPDGTPGTSGSRPRCAEIIFDAFSDCLCASSSVASDDSDGDAGLLLALLSPPSFSLAQRTSESSDFSFYSAVDSSAGLAQTSSPKHVPHWRLAQEGPFLSKIPPSAMDAPFAVPLTGLRIMLSPLKSMGCRCTAPGFWNGSALRSWLVCWIRVLVHGCTRCPMSRPLTRPANFTGTCAS